MTDPDIQQLAEKIKALPLAEKIDLAAGLVRSGRGLDTAKTVLEMALAEVTVRAARER